MQATGKAVFITGCDNDFGLALAQHLHKLGFTVIAGCLLKVSAANNRIKFGEMHLKDSIVGMQFTTRVDLWPSGAVTAWCFDMTSYKMENSFFAG